MAVELEELIIVSHEHIEVFVINVLLPGRPVEVRNRSLVSLGQSSKILSSGVDIILDTEGHGGVQPVVFVVTALALGSICLPAVLVF